MKLSRTRDKTLCGKFELTNQVSNRNANIMMPRCQLAAPQLTSLMPTRLKPLEDPHAAL